jgi:peptidoglycan L-alanyl-D-glutamate endopeptidase CwlK
MYKLSNASASKLEGVHPRLAAVVKRAIELTTQDFIVVCGLRTLEEQEELYSQGRTKPGKIVTWTLNSRHLPAPDGFGRAVDLVPYPIDWSTPSKFDSIAKAMAEAAKELKTTIRWGADWDCDGIPRERGESDSPHFELSEELNGA